MTFNMFYYPIEVYYAINILNGNKDHSNFKC